MTLVRLSGNYTLPLDRLTPAGNGCWGDIRFTTEPVEEADYFICFNYPTEREEVVCPQEHCWVLVQEPPSPLHHHLHTSHRSFSRIYSCDESLRGPHRRLTHPNLHWHLTRSLDELQAAAPPEKRADLSTITSNLEWLEGHKKRVVFLSRLRSKLDFEWYGRGIKPIDDKWDGLAPFRYSLAIENYRSDFYWTEKLMDCFLAWSMPIYFGCPRISEYFPADSLVEINLDEPEEAERIILETVASRRYEENLEALKSARDLVLQRYHPLQFLADEIKKHSASPCYCKPSKQRIEARTGPITVIDRARYALKHHLESRFHRPINI